VRYVWLAIIVVTAAPLAYVGIVMNPLFILVLGTEWWLDQLERLRPYRWWIVFVAFVFSLSMAVYTTSYGA
jgi:hypothetical protein